MKPDNKQQNITTMVVNNISITKPDTTQQNIPTMTVHDTFCINADSKQQNMTTTMYIKDTSITKT